MKLTFKLQACVVFIFVSLLVHGSYVHGKKIDWALEDAHRVSTEAREKICLNGIWRVYLKEIIKFDENIKDKNVPVLDFIKNTKSAIFPVPGEWYDDAWYNLTEYECLFPVKEKFRGPREHVCTKVTWDGKPLQDYLYGLYEREFVLPEDWKTKESFLFFEKINLEGWVFVNSKFVTYQVGIESKDIPLPKDIKPGDKVKLQVLVGSFVTGTKEKFEGPGRVIKEQEQSLSRGIVGDVWLIRRPAKRYIKDVFVITSVREKSLKLRIEYSESKLSGVLKGKITPTGKKDAAKEFSIDVKKGKKLKNGMLEYTVSWDNPVYWSPENPYLYDFYLTWNISDKKLIDSYLPVRFGFREFWIDGVDFLLNGHPYRMRMCPKSAFPNEESVEEFINMYKKQLGFNAIELSGGSQKLNIKHFFSKADEMGMLVFCIVPGANNYRYEWDKKSIREKFKKELTAYVKPIRNHPSLVQWSMNFNLLGYPFDMSPYHIATKYLPPDGFLGLGIKRRVWKGSEEMLRELDDSRPILQHAGGNHGAVSTSNLYLNFVPLQEKSEWPRLFRTKGLKPFVAIELGTPYEATYFYCHEKLRYEWYSEPLYAEYSAMLIGPEAYGMEPPERLKPILESKITPKALNGRDRYEIMSSYFWGEGDNTIRRYPFANFLKSQAYLGDFFRAWRAYGVCGYNPYANLTGRLFVKGESYNGLASYDSYKTPGIKTLFKYKTTYKKKTVLFDKYKEWFAPEFFYIGGKKEEFTDKQHAYLSSQEIIKGVVWVNDTLQDKNAELTFEVKDGNSNSVFKKNLDLKAKPGEIQINNVSFKAPEVKDKTPYTIYLSRKEGDKDVLKDRFDIQVFPKDDAGVKVNRRLFLIDKKGMTKKRLKELGVSFKDYAKGGDLGKGDLLVIGRESISEIVPMVSTIKEAVKKGLNVLVFEQTEEDLEKYLKLRAFEASGRKAFFLKESHPVQKGLSDRDLADWTGKSTLLEEYPEPAVDENPRYVWKFGNRGIVTSVVIEKPHQGAFIPLIHEGFDMAYTPLMETTLP
jgi:phosphosulfolactate synthase (CoM biosynthesis protein A)